FEKAKIEDKPIFLSIGYATCHWCHAMEQESFEDLEVADALNDSFVCIKVDREELPDVDSLYMELAQSIIWGASGWPLNLVLTPDLKPFFAATYLPKRSERGLIGLIELTQKIKGLWQSEAKERLIAQSDKIIGLLSTHHRTSGIDIAKEDLIERNAEILFRIADSVWGGVKGAPKFPLGYQSNFLLRYYLHTKEARALFLVEKTLDMMHRGGIYDHLGGGFHRYSVDDHWHVPHFEKMLYDNAILASAYLEAWKVTHRPIYREVCQETLDYIARDMQLPEGGFCSAEDADSEGFEGFYYTWSRQEVIDLLGSVKGSLFCDFYNIVDHGIVDGKNVLYMSSSIEEFVAKHKLDLLDFQLLLNEGRSILLKERSKRERPFKDDKIITAWNGLMIAAFAEAGFTLQREDYTAIALKAAQVLKTKLWQGGRLLRRYRDGEAKFAATLDDYVFLIKGLLSLFEAGRGNEWLEWAIELADVIERDFKVRGGALYQAAADNEYLLIRRTHFADGAEPSGNAVHTENLLRLYQITGNRNYLMGAEDIMRATYDLLNIYSVGYCYHLIALERFYDKHKATCVIALNSTEDWKPEIQKALTAVKSAHHAIVWQEKDSVERPCKDGKTTLYICHEGVCKEPLNSKEAILAAIAGL
ncbi:MAG: thioredoxin domain-containing protein, partial [Verrucomicrobia bacterium]|nr:thioredoxin domain-containing protein [Verrucomicrobiota bacterium]